MADPEAIKKVLGKYLERLREAISRSPLLDASPSALGRGARIDLTHLNCFGQGTADTVVDRIMNGRSCKVSPPRMSLFNADDEANAAEQNQIRVYRQFERHLIRAADKIERETGNRSLWLAYPILFLTAPNNPDRSILAPVFLWPLRIRIDQARQMCVEIEIDPKADQSATNKIMAAWIKTRRGLDLPEDEPPSTRKELRSALGVLFDGLGESTIDNPLGQIGPIPRRRDISASRSPAVLNAGLIGVMRWQNQSLMDDLEDLLKLDEFEDTLGTFATGQPVPKPPPSNYQSELDRHHVTQADYSQEQAIIQARTGPGLIIHGPPGTGKSQTITNLISDALARNETVLVVCQKRAAVDVVANNLQQVGLRDICLVVHDAISDRRQTIDHLRDQLTTLDGSPNSSTNAEAERQRLSRSIEDAERRLDSAFHELMTPRQCGLSFHEIMVGRRESPTCSGLIGITKIRPDLNPDQDELGALFGDSNLELMRRSQVLANEIGILFESCNPIEHPWQNRSAQFELTPQSRQDFEHVIVGCLDASLKHDSFCTENGCGLVLDLLPKEFERCGKDMLSSLDTLINDAKFSAIVDLYRLLDTEIGAQQNYRELASLGRTLHENPVNERMDRLYPRKTHEEEAKSRDLMEMAFAFRKNPFRMAISRYRNLRHVLRRELLDNGIQWSWTELAVLKGTLAARILRHRLDKLLRLFVTVDAHQELGDTERLKALRSLDAWIRKCTELVKRREAFPQVENLLQAIKATDLNAIKGWRQRLATAINRCGLVENAHRELAALKRFFVHEFVDDLMDRVNRGESIHDQLRSVEKTFQTVDNLMAYSRRIEQLEGDDRRLVEALIARHLSGRPSSLTLGEHWQQLIEISALNAWWSNAKHDAPILESLNEQSLRNSRIRLRDMLARKRDIEAKSIRERCNNGASEATGTEWRGLLAKTGRNAKRLRQIVHRGQDLGLFKLRPCWLTNPDTASQILPLEEGLFDLVIFDESSQLPLEQAMPAIYRGKRVVVAGDEHQLPPMSFFQTASVNESIEEEIDDDEEDADAITARQAFRSDGIQLALNATDLLDLSKDILPEKWLNVHYRSRHPSLIEYSNCAHYNGQLECAHPVWGTPTPDVAPIVYCHINGIYEKKTNRKEAQYVVALLNRIWSRTPLPPTLGVVTFNQQQEDLIEEEIAKTAATNHSFQLLLERERDRKDGHKDVGFFVKNLESVQGDERDLIVFSTTFGPTTLGQPQTFRRQFGPLTRAGGERRLNVAVTRARDAVIVVTSMVVDRISDVLTEIQPGQTVKARDYLQTYMKYAEAVSRADESSTQRWLKCAAKLSDCNRDGRMQSNLEFESEFEEQVHDRLVKAGWNVDTQVGENGFRIDLAVRHPDPAKGYLLGIECDGARFHSTLSARARDIWREDILKEYGWHIYRIWSTQWWVFPDRVMAELSDLLQSRLEQHDIRPNFRAIDIVSDYDQSIPQATATQEVKPQADQFQPPPTPSVVVADIGESVPLFSSSQLDGQPREWAVRFDSLLTGDTLEEGIIAQWQDEKTNPFELVVERKRSTPMLLLKCRNEEFGHYSVRDAKLEILQVASKRLSQVKSHADVLDWFRWLQQELHPEVWS